MHGQSVQDRRAFSSQVPLAPCSSLWLSYLLALPLERLSAFPALRHTRALQQARLSTTSVLYTWPAGAMGVHKAWRGERRGQVHMKQELALNYLTSTKAHL